jgi:two-component system, NarL family, response regulator NreC
MDSVTISLRSSTEVLAVVGATIGLILLISGLWIFAKTFTTSATPIRIRGRTVARTARILIADDHESMRRTVRCLINTNPSWEICGEANDGRKVVTKAAELKPDLVLLDFKMPGANGIEAGSEICSAMPTTPILMYTLYKTPELELAAKLVGIRQVVGKEGGAADLLSAIETELASSHSLY